MNSFLKQMTSSMRNLKKTDWLLVAGIGFFILLLAVPVGEKNNTSSIVKTDSLLSENSKESDRKQLENELSELLIAIPGVGQNKVMITFKEMEEADLFMHQQSLAVEGVVIAAEGGDDSVVAKEILDIVMSLFPIEAHKIKIVKMKSVGGIN